MSNSIYMCAASLCVSLVVCSIVRIIAPSGNTNRILSVVISVFVLCCVLSPIAELLKGFYTSSYESGYLYEEYDFSSEYDNEVMRTTGDYVNEYISLMLESSGVVNVSIKTILALDENGGIYIGDMRIYLDKSDMVKAEEVKELVMNAVGTEPVIMENVYG